MKLRVIIEQDDDGVYIAECPTLPGGVSQGRTRAEAVQNIRDAIRGYLKSLKKHGEPIPQASVKHKNHRCPLASVRC
jgi:predicted RNase H-like HicB family nuclease